MIFISLVIAVDEWTFHYALAKFEDAKDFTEVKHVSPLNNYYVRFGALKDDNPYYRMQVEFNRQSQEDLHVGQVSLIHIFFFPSFEDFLTSKSSQGGF